MIYELNAICEGRESGKSDSRILMEKIEGSKKAWKVVAICIGLAGFSVFIPLAHFVLVPGFLIAAPICYFWQKKNPLIIRKASGTCPHCAQDFEVLDQRPSFPFEVLCEGCRRVFTIRLTDDTDPASL